MVLFQVYFKTLGFCKDEHFVPSVKTMLLLLYDTESKASGAQHTTGIMAANAHRTT